jgi:hypothetical protein
MGNCEKITMGKNTHLRIIAAQAPGPINGKVQTTAPPRSVMLAAFLEEMGGKEMRAI